MLAFSAGALPVVAGYVAVDMVAADNDKSQAGEEGAKATGLPYVMPPTLGDWNDYAASHGLDGMRTALEHSEQKAVPRDEQRREQQKGENVRLQQATISTTPPSMSVKQMEADCVWIAEGSAVGLISNSQHVLGYNDFAGLTASAKTKVKDESGRENEFLTRCYGVSPTSGKRYSPARFRPVPPLYAMTLTERRR